MDDAMFVKLEIPATDLHLLLNQSVFSNADWDTEFNNIFDMPDIPEWTPSSVQTFRATDLDLPNFKYLKVLIDESSSDVSVIYLMWFET